MRFLNNFEKFFFFCFLSEYFLAKTIIEILKCMNPGN